MLLYRKSTIYVFFCLFPFVLSAGTPPDIDTSLLVTDFSHISEFPEDEQSHFIDDFESVSLEEAEAADNSEDICGIDSLLRITQSGGTIDTTLVPSAALYRLWSQVSVNPYKFDILKWKDTVDIDMSGYTHPFNNYITSEFGKRRMSFHYGIDIKLFTGDSVKCAFDGVVRMARYNRSGYGNYVVVRHFNGLETVYAHFSKTLVKVNQPVRSGDVLGLGGNTGRSTGSHLHFEMRYLGHAFNPRDIVDFDAGIVKSPDMLLSINNYKHEVEMAQTRYYTIRKGDTLGRIAMRNGVSVSKLCKLNGIKTTTILRIGRRLKISGPQ